MGGFVAPFRVVIVPNDSLPHLGVWLNEVLQLHDKPFDLSTVNVDPEPTTRSTVNPDGNERIDSRTERALTQYLTVLADVGRAKGAGVTAGPATPPGSAAAP
jgi:hypothetical protein